jgi:ABC-type antimicrobial peptide transport system permease subunit
VEEPWLKQGAAIEYLRAGTAQHLYIVLILVCAAAVYLVAAFTSLGLADVKANAIRRAVGWSRASVFRREMTRAMKVGTVGSFVGILAGTVTASILSLPQSVPIAVAGAVLGLLLCCAAAILPAWKSGGMQLAPILSGGEIALTGERKRRAWRRPATGIVNLSLRQLGRLRARAALALAGGVIATGSLMLIVGLQQRFSGSLQVTILGQQILLETGILQVAVAIVALVLAFALIGEILYQTVMDRAGEIATYRAMGWRKSQVARLMIWQGVVLGIGCALLGVATWGLVLVLTLGGDAWAIVASGALSAVVGGGLLGLAAAGLPAWRAASKRPVEAAGTT